MKTQPIVSPQEWQEAWEGMLVKEKEVTRARDALAAERRRMPWMVVEKHYRFKGPKGEASLLDLFQGRRQLIVYRAFYAPDITTFAEGGSYPDRACVGCSLVADQVAHPAHLNARDTALAFVSRAPQPDIEHLKARNGWELILVHADRRLRCGLRRRRVARDQRLPPRRRRDLPHLLHQQPRRRGDGEHVELPRSDRPRPPRGVGGLARGLPADAALPVVEPPRRVRPGARVIIAHIAGVPVEETVPLLAGARRRAGHARMGDGALRRRRRERGSERRQDAAHRAHLQRASRGRFRRVDERGDAALVARRARLGDGRGAGRSARRRCGASRHARPDDGAEYGGGGTYRVDPPTRLAFTWLWDGETHRTLIEIDFGDRRRHRRHVHSGLWDGDRARTSAGGPALGQPR